MSGASIQASTKTRQRQGRCLCR